MHGDEILHLYELTQRPRAKAATEGNGSRRAGDRPLRRRRRSQRIGKLSRPMRVVYDCGNGAGALVAPQLFERLGTQGRGLFCESDGTFPNHHPDPTVPEESRGPHRRGASRRRRDRHRVRRRRRSHRRRRRQRRHRLGRSDSDPLRARRARAHGTRPADHLRREVLAGAARRRSRTPAASR